MAELETLMQGLRPKQRRFVECLIQNGGNQTQAAKDAGYQCGSESSFGARGAENVRKSKIKAVLDVYERDVQKRTRAKIAYTREDAIREYDEAIELAKKEGQPSAICQAVKGKAELLGLFYEPAQNPSDRQPMTREEILEALAELDGVNAQARTIQLQVNRRTGG